MTVNDYILQKFQTFGVNLSEAELFDICLNAKISGGGEMNEDCQTRVSVAIAKFIPCLLYTSEISEVLARGRATINATVRAKFLAMALGGIKTKSTVVRKLRDSEGNLTGEDELQVSESELAPNLQAMSVWLYHHDEDWRKIERKQDEDADIPTDIEHGINNDSWFKDKLT